MGLDTAIDRAQHRAPVAQVRHSMSTWTVARIPRVAFVLASAAIFLAGTLGTAVPASGASPAAPGVGPGADRAHHPDRSRPGRPRHQPPRLRAALPHARSGRSARGQAARRGHRLARPPRSVHRSADPARRPLQQPQQPGPEPTHRRAAGQHRRDRSEQLRRDGEPGDRCLRPQPQPDQQHRQRHLHGRRRELDGHRSADPVGRAERPLALRGAGRGDRRQHAALRLVQDVGPERSDERLVPVRHRRAATCSTTIPSSGTTTTSSASGRTSTTTAAGPTRSSPPTSSSSGSRRPVTRAARSNTVLYVADAAHPLHNADGSTAFTPVPANTADSSAVRLHRRRPFTGRRHRQLGSEDHGLALGPVRRLTGAGERR